MLLNLRMHIIIRHPRAPAKLLIIRLYYMRRKQIGFVVLTVATLYIYR